MNTKLSKLIAHRTILVRDLDKNISTSTARKVTKAIESLNVLIRIINLGNEPTTELVTKKSVRYVMKKENLNHLITDRRIYTTVGWLTLKNIYLSLNGVGSMASITLGVHTIFIHAKYDTTMHTYKKSSVKAGIPEAFIGNDIIVNGTRYPLNTIVLTDSPTNSLGKVFGSIYAHLKSNVSPTQE